MPDQIPNAVKKQREEVLMEMDRVNRTAYAARFRDRSVEVLFEEPVRIGNERYMKGRTREALDVLFRTDADLSGVIARAEVERADGGTLTAKGIE